MSAINGAADQSAASFGYQELTDDRSDFSAPKRTPFERLERIVRTACRPVVRRLPGRIQRSLKRLSDIRRNRVLLERLPFDEETYLRLNPDVAETVRQERFTSGLEHFVTFGIDELETSPNRVLRIPLHGLQFDFDPSAYCIDNPDAAMLIAQGRYRSAIDHFLRAGYDQCREGIRSLYAPDRLVRCLAVEDGDSTLARDRRYLALFAHYDQAGVIDDYVVHYLKALRDAGADICFITSSAAPNELNKIRQYAFRIIIKNDAGRDFGSWYVALKNIQADLRAQYDYVLLVNDSVYFPVVDCGRMFDGMTTLKFDLWGITDSRQSARYHLQSYFLGLNRTAQGVLIPWLMETISSTPYMTKFGQICSLEFALTERAMDAGLTVGAYCSIDDIREDVIRDRELAHLRPLLQLGLGGINPTHHVWDALIRRYHCPALKIELLRDNPLRSNIRNWRSAIDPRTFDRTIIERHLKRIKESQSTQQLKTDMARGGSSQTELLHTVGGRGFGRGQRLVLFAHYDPHAIIDPHVEITIRELNNNGCDVALITPSTKRSELERLRPLCSSILIKNPHGRDFGSWFIASNSLKAHYPLYQTIIWMNDSTYFPLFDPGTMFGVMERKAHDFWGIVDSYNLRWHIMSWFWAFRRDLVEAGWPNTYIGQYEPGYSKWDQIKNYEMRLPIALRNAGYRTGAYVSADDLILHIRDHQPTHDKFSGRTDFSMTHDFWDVIIHQFRCPALKVELLRDNPLGLELKDVFSFITQHTTYDAELIRSHLARIKAVVSSNSRPIIAKPSNDQLQSLDLYQSYTARPFHSALRGIESSENAHSN